MDLEARTEVARLENYANNFSPPSDLHKHIALVGDTLATSVESSPRRYRYERRRLLWAESSLPRVKKCGKVLRGDGVIVRYREGVGAGFAGLTTCGSVWAEPVCNAKIMARRAFEIGGALAVWQMHGKAAVFATYTMRHHRGQSITELWQGLTKAWHHVTLGMPWQKLKARHGIAGWCRVVEVTWGVNGWHVHTHVVFFLETAVSDAEVTELHRAVFDRWSTGLVKSGLGVPLLSGQDAHLVTGPADASIAAYFTKATDQARNLGLEMTHTQSKAARTEHSTLPPWHLLDLVQQGDADALDLWHEYEGGSKGKRQISWSAGLRHMLGLMAEQSDEAIAAEEVGSRNDDLVFITADGWHRLLSVPGLSLADVLSTTERAGLPGLRALLDAEQIEYHLLGGLAHAA